MKEISARRGNIIKNADSLQKVTLVEAALPLLKPFADATDMAQSGNATLWHQLLLLEFLPCATLPANRRKQLITDGICLLAFLMPNVKRHLIIQRLGDRLRLILRGLRKMAENVFGDESINNSLEKEFNTFCMSPPAAMQGGITIRQFSDWWLLASERFPRLATIATTIVEVCPSEACVERVFSKMKHLVGKCRTNMKEESVEAQLIINSALAFDKQEIDVDHWKDDGRKVADTTIQWVMTEATPAAPAQPAAGRRRTRRLDDICTLCERYFESHSDGVTSPSVECDVCQKWYALECIGVPAHLLPALAHGWQCGRSATRCERGL